MAHYIDKDALVAEIKERIETYNKGYANGDDRRADALDILLHDLDTLEAKEVDLEEEIKESILNEWCNEWSDDIGNWIRCCRGTRSMTIEDVKDIAKHFFELGMQQSNNNYNNEEKS